MNEEIASSLYVYFEQLYVLNQKLIKLCGTSLIGRFQENKTLILDIIQDIPRILPYGGRKNSKEIELKKDNGLLAYSSNIEYLYDSYLKILEENKKFLYNIKQIRNKFEHSIHLIKYQSSSSGSQTYFSFTFSIKDEVYKVSAQGFIKLLISLNELFSKLYKEVSYFAYKNDLADNEYYKKITSFDFAKFNEIYNSNLLRLIGEIMWNY